MKFEEFMDNHSLKEIDLEEVGIQYFIIPVIKYDADEQIVANIYGIFEDGIMSAPIMLFVNSFGEEVEEVTNEMIVKVDENELPFLTETIHSYQNRIEEIKELKSLIEKK